jgi:hypothetical protein
LKLSELKSMISQVASQKYNEVFRNLFQEPSVCMVTASTPGL